MDPSPRSRRPLWLFVACFLGAGLVLGWLLYTNRSLRLEARERFFDQYNRQQLLLAEQASRTIEELFATFRRNLSLVGSLFEDGPVTRERAVAVEGSLTRVYELLGDTPIIDLVVFDRVGDVVAIVPADEYTLGRNYAWREYYLWARDRGRPGQMYLSPFMRMEGGQHRGDKALIVAEGIYAANGGFKGVVAFTVNFDALARKHILSIQIGEYGYAWLVDSYNRTVLVDPRGRIGGQRFDAAFRDRWPKLYDLLVSTRDGRPGMDWYAFEDPADPAKTVRKLVGYAPVRIQERLWTLGVCTPERQVEALLASFLRRQEVFSGTAMATILAGTALLSGLLLAWNRSLTREVGSRTRELERARTRLEEAFDELLTARKAAAVGNLALGMAHEIRNPLSAIRMNMQMIRKRIGDDQALAENFAIAEEEILRLNHLLTEVMTFAKPRPLHLASVDLASTVERVVALVAQRTAREGIRVAVDMEPGLDPITCDGEQIQQVLLNLVLNGIDAASGRDGPRRLEIRASRDDDAVELRVWDNGPGIDPEHLDRLFDPFFTTKAHGVGLGLAVSETIVLRHGGALHAERPPEGGAAFVVRLPTAGARFVAKEAR